MGRGRLLQCEKYFLLLQGGSELSTACKAVRLQEIRRKDYALGPRPSALQTVAVALSSAATWTSSPIVISCVGSFANVVENEN